MMRCGIYLRCFPRSCDLMWCTSTAASAAAESGYWCCDCIHGIKNEGYVQRSLSVDHDEHICLKYGIRGRDDLHTLAALPSN